MTIQARRLFHFIIISAQKLKHNPNLYLQDATGKR
jgi:hypothetical protein